MFNRFFSMVGDAIEAVKDFLRGGDTAAPHDEEPVLSPSDPFMEDWVDPSEWEHEIITDWIEVRRYLEDSEPAEEEQGMGYLIDEVPEQYDVRAQIFSTRTEVEEYIEDWGAGITWIFQDEEGFYRLAVLDTTDKPEVAWSG